MTEFELIKNFFTKPARLTSTHLAVGDDCALLTSTANKALAVSTDVLVEGVHFFKQVDPYSLGYKALAINLSDLAAMGAKPFAFLLSLTLPEADATWLAQFSAGLYACADEYQIDLVGGNTAHGPLNINITVMGEVDQQQALRRDRAKVGDDIYVTGYLGGAALGLQSITSNMSTLNTEQALARFNMPKPQIVLAQKLLGLAHAAIDISDGLAQDLTHILAASKLGATLWLNEVPVFMGSTLELALNGGEDYELCFTAPITHREQIQQLGQQLSVNITRIGRMTDTKELICLDANHQEVPIKIHGYQHF